MRIAVDEAVACAQAAFGPLGELCFFKGRSVTAGDLADVDAIIVRTVTRVDSRLIEGTPVRFVGAISVGTDHLDIDYLHARGITVAHAAGCNANAVAEYVLAAISVIAAKENWDLGKKSIGIIGVGNIGSRVARKAAILGMKVMLCDPPLRKTTGDSRYLDLQEVLGADILTLHVPLTVEGPHATHHLFEQDIFNKLAPNQWLLNTSRGPVVSGKDLKTALCEKRIAGAILDVWEGEPALDCNLLDRVEIGTPHIAGFSIDGKVRATEMIADRICAFLGRPSSWSGREILPLPRFLKLAPGTAGFDAIRSALLQAYDIRQDDRALRSIRHEAGIANPEDFERLRTNYVLRPEFSHFVVELPGGSNLEPVLRALGFQVEASAS